MYRAGRIGRDVLVPGHRADGRQGPTYDAVGALKSDAETLGFPVRMPKLPDGLAAQLRQPRRSRSGRIDPKTGQPVRALVSTVGYLTPTGMYVSLTQSNADEDKLVRLIHSEVYPTGPRTWRGRSGSSTKAPPPAERCRTRLDHPTRRPRRVDPDRDNRRRVARRVPYAGDSDSDPAAASRPLTAGSARTGRDMR